MSNFEIIAVCFAITLVLCQGVWVFLDASKRNENKWLWGLFCSLNTPTNLLVYLLVTRVIKKQITCPDCEQKQHADSKICQRCGHEWLGKK